MSFKPVVLIYDLDTKLVDDIATTIGSTGLYTTINTFNEGNAIDALRQYNRGFGLLTNKLTCIITGWNNFKNRRDQFLFQVRNAEKRGGFRKPTPVIIVTEDHMLDLKKIALDPEDGNVSGYLDVDNFRDSITEILHQIVYESKAIELNRAAYQALLQQPD